MRLFEPEDCGPADFRGRPARSTRPTRRAAGGRDVWLTPPGIIAALGPFDLDPCAAPEPRPWPTAARHLALPEDGLQLPWSGRVWLNPPYGDQTGAWLGRLAAHGDGIALTFVRSETREFHLHVWEAAAAVFFFRGRLRFYTPEGERGKSAPAPSLLIAYGPECSARLREADLPGRYVSLV